MRLPQRGRTKIGADLDGLRSGRQIRFALDHADLQRGHWSRRCLLGHHPEGVGRFHAGSSDSGDRLGRRSLDLTEPALLVPDEVVPPLGDALVDDGAVGSCRQPRVGLEVERALRVDTLLALLAVEELPRIARVVLLDVEDRLVHERERDLGRDRVAVVVARCHAQRAGLTRLELLAVRLHLDLEEVVHRGDHDLSAVQQQLAVVHHGGLEEHVRDVPLLDRELDQLDRAVEVDQAVVVQLLALDREQDPGALHRRAEHHRGRATRSQRVLIDQDLHAAVAVADLRRVAVGDPHGGLGPDRPVLLLVADPTDAIEPVALGSEIELRRSLVVGADQPGQDLLVLVPLELQTPFGITAAPRRGWKHGLASSDFLQVGSGDLTTRGVDPGLDPPVARHPNPALRGQRTLVRIDRLELDAHTILAAVQVVPRAGKGEVTLATDPNGAAADHLAPRGVGHAGLDGVLEVLARAARRLERDTGPAGLVGGQRLALDDLSGTAPPVVALRRHVLVEPRERTRRRPPDVQRLLVNHGLDRRPGDGPAEVVLRDDLRLDLLADAERFGPVVLGGCLDADLELGQFVLFHAEQHGAADMPVLLDVAQHDLVLAQG